MCGMHVLQLFMATLELSRAFRTVSSTAYSTFSGQRQLKIQLSIRSLVAFPNGRNCTPQRAPTTSPDAEVCLPSPWVSPLMRLVHRQVIFVCCIYGYGDVEVRRRSWTSRTAQRHGRATRFESQCRLGICLALIILHGLYRDKT